MSGLMRARAAVLAALSVLVVSGWLGLDGSPWALTVLVLGAMGCGGIGCFDAAETLSNREKEG